MKLTKSHVLFDAAAHTYTLDGVSLHGITHMIEHQLFPDKYKGVPQAIMRRAADRGTVVHESCELADDILIASDMPEVQNYQRLKSEQHLTYEASEYLVSDNTYFASCIDKVYREADDTFTLADIKTTAKLDTEYVRWQLSIYAHLFEMQNPGAKVLRLIAIWLRGDQCAAVEVERIPRDYVVALMTAEMNGLQYTNPYPSAVVNLPDKYRQMEAAIAEICLQEKYWADKKKELLDGVLSEMIRAGQSKWVGDSVSFTMRAPSVRKGFDTNRFRADHPDLYAQYVKESPITSSVTIKLK